jgi:hypothetical protein
VGSTAFHSSFNCVLFNVGSKVLNLEGRYILWIWCLSYDGDVNSDVDNDIKAMMMMMITVTILQKRIVMMMMSIMIKSSNTDDKIDDSDYRLLNLPSNESSFSYSWSTTHSWDL